MGSEYKIGGKKGEVGGKDAYQNLNIWLYFLCWSFHCKKVLIRKRRTFSLQYDTTVKANFLGRRVCVRSNLEWYGSQPSFEGEPDCSGVWASHQCSRICDQAADCPSQWYRHSSGCTNQITYRYRKNFDFLGSDCAKVCCSYSSHVSTYLACSRRFRTMTTSRASRKAYLIWLLRRVKPASGKLLKVKRQLALNVPRSSQSFTRFSRICWMMGTDESLMLWYLCRHVSWPFKSRRKPINCFLEPSSSALPCILTHSKSILLLQ